MNAALDWRTAPVPFIAGLTDTRKDGAQPYAVRPLGEIVATATPFSLPKNRAYAFLPSLYAANDARSHSAQRERGRFVALVGDIDEGDHPLAQVEQAIDKLARGVARSIYSTASAAPDGKRWRIIVPLAVVLPYEAWRDAQLALVDHMAGEGITLDTCAARPGQISYLPNVPEEARTPSGEPRFFEQASSERDAPGLEVSTGPIAKRIAALRERRIADDAERERIKAEAFTRRARRPVTWGAGGSMIEAFNRDNAVTTMLERYGYQQSTRHAEDWRSPMQTSDSFATRIIEGGKWISLSGSDAAAGLGDRFGAGCYGDAFDLFVHFEHRGDRTAALRQLRREREGAFPATSRQHEVSRPFDPETGEIAAEHRAQNEAPREPSRRAIELADFYAYMPTHSYIFAPSGEFWPASSVNSRIPPIPLVDDQGAPILHAKGKRQGEQIELLANAWLDQKRPVEQMTWAPGFGQVVRDRLISEGGWIERRGNSVFNLYRPAMPPSGDAGRAQPWIDHVRKVYPDDADHLIHWLAHRVQKPAEKINHAIVMGGAQGIGKDTILEPVKAAIGPWNFAEVSPQHMLGRFNGFVKSVILRVSEARDLGDVDRFAFYDHMKTYTAAPPDVLRVDEKHVREYSVFNVCGVIITTNHKADGIYLPADDRRHYVAWSECTRESFDSAYWTQLYAWYGSGGLGHVCAYLASCDLSSFDAKAPPHKTNAFWDIVSSNQAPEEAELADALETLAWPNAVTVASVADAACSGFREFLLERRNSRRIPHRFEECGYVQVRNDGARDGLFKVGGKRCVIYAKKTLARRDQIAAAERLIYPGRQ